MRTLLAIACVASSVAVTAQVPRDTAAPRPNAPAVVSRTTGTGSISGTVVSDDAEARPLRRAVVTVSGSNLHPSRAIVSDDAGRFAFRELPSGNFTLEVVKPGYVSSRYGQKRPGRGAGVVLSLGVGEAMNDLTVRVPRGGSITGTVTDDMGRPRRNVSIVVYESRIINGTRRLTTVASSVTGEFVRPTTDDRGVFRAYGMPPGDYVVAATQFPMPDMGPGLDLRLPSPAELQWAADQVRAGNAAGNPVPGTPVAGSVGMPSPAPGRRVGAATVYYPGTTDPGAAGVITLGRSEERGSVDFAVGFVPTSRVEGRVVTSDGQPAAGVMLLAQRAGRMTPGPVNLGATATRSGGDGTFSIGNLAPGAYSIGARSPMARGAGPGALRGGGPPASLWAMADVAVNGEDASGLTLVLQPGLTLSGRVTFAGPSAGAPPDVKTVPLRLSLTPMLDESPYWNTPATTVNPDGTFEIAGIQPGRYRLTSGSSGPHGGEPEAAWLLQSATLDGRDIADVPFEVGGTPLSGLTVTMSRRLAEVSGTLLDALGRPTPDYFVVVFSTNRDHWLEGSRRVPAPVRPSSNGTYRVASLPAGTYYLAALTDVDPQELFDRAFLEQVAAGGLTITLADGETKLQDLKLAGR